MCAQVTATYHEGVEHLVIGASGVRDCAKLRAFILDGCRHALSASLAHAQSLAERSASPLPKRRTSIAL